ncbi:MAG: polysaccharide deacetylase family protein [Spirochaetales bacterium]|nr:polysaccharide deacetylase family protein [Spirochaetales bacterium]
MFIITRPALCCSEIDYTLKVVFSDWLGIDYKIKTGVLQEIQIYGNDKTLNIPVTFFEKASKLWLNEETLPVLPLKSLSHNELPSSISRFLFPSSDNIPVLYGQPTIMLFLNQIVCSVDLIGGIFFMLSRYEEVVINERDKHDRFPAKSSIAVKENFYDRPIANEYLQLLWGMMKTLWPNIERKQRSFKIHPSHDIDKPFEDFYRPPHLMLQRFAGDVLKRKKINVAIENYKRWHNVRKGEYHTDRFFSFDFIMSESEKRNLKSTFFFLPSGSPEQKICIGATNPFLINKMKDISTRGHEIGIHGHYLTYLNKNEYIRETEKLRNILNTNGISQELKGGRQHYLRVNIPETFRIWEAANLEYDSTIGFSDRPGFRCGTCYEYQLYDVINRKALNIKEKPLVVMEGTIIYKHNMGKGYSADAFNIFKKFKDICRFYRGDFTLLWHNNEFVKREQRDLYCSVLDSE